MIGFFESLDGLMRFTSLSYLAFVAVVAITYFLLRGVAGRVALLLAASLTFYMLLSPRTVVVLLVVAGLSWGAGLLIVRLQADVGGPRSKRLARAVLSVGVALVVATLIGYKYVPFLQQLATGVLGSKVGTTAFLVNLALPLGISFWTFQAIAYMVDVYRDPDTVERNPFVYLLAVGYFPIVTSGPITRVRMLTTQFRARHAFDYERMQSGLLLIGLGFFKKLMIADRLAVFVNTVFDNPSRVTAQTNGLLFLIAAVFFAIQLYCDFSGYTDIVRGSSRLLGIELPVNFAAPYFSRSVREFWRRWHMSLMDWLREYVYFPLGGNRKGPIRKQVNVLAVFALSGLWHGTGLTYLGWGLLNGMYIVAGDLLAPIRDRLVTLLHIDRDSFGHRVFQTVTTFALITIAWVFFRAETVSDALYIVPRMFSPTVWVLTDGSLVKQGLSLAELLVALLAIAGLGMYECLSMRMDVLAALRRQHVLYRWTAYYALILAVVVFGHYGGTYNAADFLYFKY